MFTISPQDACFPIPHQLHYSSLAQPIFLSLESLKQPKENDGIDGCGKANANRTPELRSFGQSLLGCQALFSYPVT
jgi:hypothetical protein